MATREEHIAYRYYRMLWTGPTNSDYKGIYNWLLSETVGGAHKTGGTITYSSTTTGNPNEAPAKAFDADMNTAWVALAQVGDQWLKIDYGAPVLIKETSFYTSQMHGGKWLLQGSNDDATWTTLFDWSPLASGHWNDGKRIVRYSLQKTKYRLNVLSTRGNSYIFLAEMYLLNESGARIPSGSGSSFWIQASTLQNADPTNSEGWSRITDNDPATQGAFNTGVKFFLSADVPAIGFGIRQGNRSDTGIISWSLDRSDDYGVTWTNIVGPQTESDWASGALWERLFDQPVSAKKPRRLVNFMYVPLP